MPLAYQGSISRRPLNGRLADRPTGRTHAAPHGARLDASGGAACAPGWNGTSDHLEVRKVRSRTAARPAPGGTGRRTAAGSCPTTPHMLPHIIDNVVIAGMNSRRAHACQAIPRISGRPPFVSQPNESPDRAPLTRPIQPPPTRPTDVAAGPRWSAPPHRPRIDRSGLATLSAPSPEWYSP